MAKKTSKVHLRKCPPKGTIEWELWRQSISKGKKKSKHRRRQLGLLSMTEVAVLYELPICFVRRLIAEGTLPVLQAGMRRYARVADVELVLGKQQKTA